VTWWAELLENGRPGPRNIIPAVYLQELQLSTFRSSRGSGCKRRPLQRVTRSLRATLRQTVPTEVTAGSIFIQFCWVGYFVIWNSLHLPTAFAVVQHEQVVIISSCTFRPLNMRRQSFLKTSSNNHSAKGRHIPRKRRRPNSPSLSLSLSLSHTHTHTHTHTRARARAWRNLFITGPRRTQNIYSFQPIFRWTHALLNNKLPYNRYFIYHLTSLLWKNKKPLHLAQTVHRFCTIPRFNNVTYLNSRNGLGFIMEM